MSSKQQGIATDATSEALADAAEMLQQKAAAKEKSKMVLDEPTKAGMEDDHHESCTSLLFVNEVDVDELEESAMSLSATQEAAIDVALNVSGHHVRRAPTQDTSTDDSIDAIKAAEKAHAIKNNKTNNLKPQQKYQGRRTRRQGSNENETTTSSPSTAGKDTNTSETTRMMDEAWQSVEVSTEFMAATQQAVLQMALAPSSHLTNNNGTGDNDEDEDEDEDAKERDSFFAMDFVVREPTFPSNTASAAMEMDHSSNSNNTATHPTDHKPRPDQAGMRPGAYSRRPGGSAERRSTFVYSASTSNNDPNKSEELPQMSPSISMEYSTTSRELHLQQQATQDEEETGGAIEGGLVEAKPVLDPSSIFMASQLDLFEVQEEGQGSRQTQKQTRKMLLSMALGICAIVGIVLGLVLGLQSKSQEGSTATSAINSSNTIPPTMAPTVFLIEDLPEYTKETIWNDLDGTSPQARAHDWMLNDPHGWRTYPVERLLQRFALATFYFSTNGDNWASHGIANSTATLAPTFMTNGSFVVDPEWQEQDFIPPPPPPPPGLGAGGDGGPLDGTAPLRGDHNTSLAGRPPGAGPPPGMGPPPIGGRPPPGMGEDVVLLPPGQVNALWLDYDHHECHWFNQNHHESMSVCNINGLYVNLFMTTNNLSGSLPRELSLLTELDGLILSSNKLTGTPPPQMFGGLKKAKSLELDGNLLTGQIPSEVGFAGCLRLGLARNQLSGSIPTELLRLSSLNYLDLSENSLTGSIPTLLGSLSRLKFVALDDNSLSSSIPSELGLLSSLQTLELSTNQLTSTLPSELGQLTDLVALTLADNSELHGSIPEEMGALAALGNTTFSRGLVKVHLSGTGLSGTIPQEWCENLNDISYDCSVTLCGCDDCACD